MRWRTRTRIGLAALCACAVVAGCAPAERRPLQVGDLAPEYGAPSLAGDSLSLSDFEGRPVVVNLWATWCAPCRQEMPELQALADRYGDALAVVGVSIDRPGAEEDVRGFLAEVGVDFPILLDPRERFVHRFMTIGVPETFLIDADGVVRLRWTGRYHPLSEENLAVVEAVIAEAG